MPNDLDICIKGGTLIDGTGAPGIACDVGIRDGRIARLGDIREPAHDTIDAQGLVVAPGFVDIHTHYDAQVFWDPTLSPSCQHGVTTIVGGNCGFSIAPLSGRPEDADYLMRMLARVEGMPLESLRAGVPWNWTSFESFLASFEGTVALNTAFMVGHSALRRTAMGARAVGHKAAPAEVETMRSLLRASLAAGGLGFSTTVSPAHNDGEGNPVPSRHASREELLALAAVVSEFPGTTIEFLPNAMIEFSEEQLALMTDMSLAAQRPLNWNMINPDSRAPHIARSQLGASDYAAARGARVVPLVAGKVSTQVINFVTAFSIDTFTGWHDVMHLPLTERKAALADPSVRRRLDAGAHAEGQGLRTLLADWGQWTFAEVYNPDNKRFQGLKVAEVARAQGKNPFDALLDIVIADDLKTSLRMPPRGADEESWRMRGEMWSDERTVIGASDAGAHLDMIDSFATSTIVLSEGVRKRKLVTLEEAVRQLSSVPAGLIGLKERGEIRQGNWADVIVFDPLTVGREPVYTRYDMPGGAGRLYAGASGMRHVLVNGQEILRDGKGTGKFPGQVLRSGRATRTVALTARN